MLYEYSIKTGRQGFYDVTRQVREAVGKSGVMEGFCLVFCPHTTAGMTINENADPDVVQDLLLALDKTYPHRPEFRHAEGNSAAHLKASVLGSSVSLPLEQGKPILGIWQGIYFAEFDGPRTRKFLVQVLGAESVH